MHLGVHSGLSALGLFSPANLFEACHLCFVFGLTSSGHWGSSFGCTDNRLIFSVARYQNRFWLASCWKTCSDKIPLASHQMNPFPTVIQPWSLHTRSSSGRQVLMRRRWPGFVSWKPMFWNQSFGQTTRLHLICSDSQLLDVSFWHPLEQPGWMMC